VCLLRRRYMYIKIIRVYEIWEIFSTLHLIRGKSCISVAFYSSNSGIGLQYTIMAQCVRIIHEDVNFSRWGGVCKTRGPQLVLPGMIVNPWHRRIRGATHFKQTFHLRIFLWLQHSVPFISHSVSGKSLFIAPCRYRKIENSTPGARRSFPWDVIGVKTSPSVRWRWSRVSLPLPAEK